MGEALATRRLLLIAIPHFRDDNTTFAVAVQSVSDMNLVLVQINYAFMTSLHSRHGDT